MSYSLCGNIGANTGAISCDVRRGRPVGIIIGGAVFQAADYVNSATFQAAFQTRVRRAAGSPDKLYPFPEIQGNTDQTDADKTGTLGYGLKFILQQGKPAYQFDMIAGTTQEKALRKFNNQQVPVYVFDDASNIWGVTDSGAEFFGAQCLIAVKGKGFDDAQNPKTTQVTISFINASDFYDDEAFVGTSFGIGDLQGLVDVQLSEGTAHSSNVMHIVAKVFTTELGVTLNPYDYFADALASASLWLFSSAGVPITITSVAKNTTIKGWDVTLDSTAYTALAAGAKISAMWTDPGTLTTAGVTQSETPQPLIITK